MKRSGVIQLQAIALLVFGSPSLTSQAEQDADWLKPRVEYQGKAITATIESIISDDYDDSRKITLSIPKDAIETTDAIEEIVVVGKAPKKDRKAPGVKIRYHWASDYDNDHYGLIITVGDATNFPIRLYLKGDADEP